MRIDLHAKFLVADNFADQRPSPNGTLRGHVVHGQFANLFDAWTFGSLVAGNDLDRVLAQRAALKDMESYRPSRMELINENGKQKVQNNALKTRC